MGHSARNEIIRSLCEFSGKDLNTQFVETSWIEATGFDSLALFNFLLNIEKALSFRFTDEEFSLSEIRDFENFVRIVDRHRNPPL